MIDVVPNAGVIALGKQGENQAVRVTLPNIRAGSGSILLLHQRSDDQKPYPVPVVEADGGIIWTVSSTDTAYPGRGQAELQWLGVNGEVAKSVTYQTNTTRSMAEPGAVPDEPLKPYTQAVARDAQAAKDAAASATEAARSAETSAGQAGLSAENAAKSLKKLEDGIASGDFHGQDGKSAYQLAVDAGFDGTETQWLESLKGAPGDTTAADAAAEAAKKAAKEAQRAAEDCTGKVSELKEDLDDVDNRFSKTINFYNPSTLVDGFYVDDNTGEIKAYNNWSYFETNLSSGTYIFSILDSDNEPSKRSVNVTLFFASYDSNGKYISGSHTDKTGIVEVPNGARKTLISSHTRNFKGYANITEPMLSTQEYYTDNGSYKPYSVPTLKEEHIPEEIVRKNDLNNLIVSGYTSELLGKNSEIFDGEIDTTISTVLKITNKPCVVFPIVTDTHYDSGNDDNARRTLDTFKNLKALTKQISFDGIIHLGDVLTYNPTYDTEDKVDASNQFVLSLMKECSNDVYVVPGNHDGINGGVPQTQNYSTYGRINAKTVVRIFDKPYYYADISYAKLRFVFLATNENDNGNNVWGCSNGQLLWFENTLKSTPNDYNIMLFSHIGTFDTNDFRTNRDEVCNLINAYNANSGDFSLKAGKILAWVTGHEHLDCILPTKASGINIPQITSQCSLLSGWTPTESYPYIYPYGWKVHVREDGKISQDCWDVMVYVPDEEKIYFVRFGAGEDREIDLSAWTHLIS